MDLEQLLRSGELEQAYHSCELEREVAQSLGTTYMTLYNFFLRHPEVNRLSWLKQPERLNTRWLKYQSSEELNSKLRDEYHRLGCKNFCAKYNARGNLPEILDFLQLRKGQKFYVSPYSRSGYSAFLPKNPLLEESDFKYWFLGYFLGDGALTEVSPRVDIYSTDRQVISLLYLSFGLSMEETRYTEKLSLVPNRKPLYVFHTTDRSLISLLKSYGFVVNKSKYGWDGWNYIPDGYRPAFLRGLYEADGSYIYSSGGRSRALLWLGHLTYIRPISEYLGSTVRRAGSVWCTSVSNVQSRSIISKMYPTLDCLGTPEYPSNLRKAHKALEVLNGK